ncbi:MAG TPA: glycosyltransferase family 87 protein [Solirubrobacteraceae bacterium]
MIARLRESAPQLGARASGRQPALREGALWVAFACACAATTAWFGLKGFAWSDYETEARPSFEALTHGHLLEFLRLAPAYGGSLVLRAPFALLPHLWGGGALAVYRMVALPALLALMALSVWLALRMRSTGQTRLAAGVALVLCVLNPVAIYALEYGHPEDLLCAVLVIVSVACATRERPMWSGVLLGLAIATKAWGLIALAPVLVALPSRRPRALLAAIVCATLVLAPLSLARPSDRLAGVGGPALQTGALFQPWQVWWWLGSHSTAVHNTNGQIRPGYRAAPAWVSKISHPLIVLLAMPLSLLWLRRRKSSRPGRGRAKDVPGSEWDALALLALVMLARCLLDPWDNVYYALPFLLALTSWEALARGRPPLLGLSATMMVALTFELIPSYLSPDGQSAFFLAWTLPLAAVLAHALYFPGRALVDARKLLGQARKPLSAALADNG